MPKMKSHKGLLKRVKITGQGKIKFKRANAGHLMSHKTGEKVHKLRQKRVAKAGDIPRLKKMLHRPLTPSNRDLREEAQAEKERLERAGNQTAA